MELWSLLSITAPGLFPDPKRFAEDVRAPDRARRRRRSGSPRLRRRIKPLVKRRTKELVAADLPAKQEQILDVDLHPRHRKLYDTHLQRERQKILGLLADFDRNRFTILRSLTLLRQLSLHAGLVDRDARARSRAPSSTRWSSSSTTWPAAVIARSSSASSPASSPACATRLDAAGHRLLLPRRRGPGSAARVLDRFRTGDDPVFLISLKAGGVRPQPDRGRLLLPARPLVEPGHREPGDRPHPPHRPDPAGDGLPADRRATRSRRRWSRSHSARPSSSAASWTTATSSRAASPPTTSAACSSRPADESLRPERALC